VDTFDADLAGFRHDWLMHGKAETTIKEYERQLRRYRATGAESVSLAECRTFVATEAARTRSGTRLASRALKAFSSWQAHEYDELDVLGPWVSIAV